MCRRSGCDVTEREAYRVMKKWKLLQRDKPREAEVYQAAKLFELLPTGPNRLWQMDVTYVHIAGYGWHYAVTVIDYYSRYLLAAHLTTSYSAAECEVALAKARAEAEDLCGKLVEPVFLVTDNGSSFIARRFAGFVRDAGMSQVRIQYRTPQQLGLLERFHQTLKSEEVYWNLYASPYEARVSLAAFRERYNLERPHWALRPEGDGDPHVPFEVYALGKRVVLPKWQGFRPKECAM
jgi:transposase InsO family protein